MATVPGQLIWEIVKRNNCFLVKEFGNGTQGVQFSKESNNLYNLNTYKHSGLANKKTITIQPGGKDQSILLATTKTKKQNKPASLLNKSLMKKEFNRMAKAVSNQVADNHYRPDLKNAALARLSVVNRSLKVAKSGVKKKTRQKEMEDKSESRIKRQKPDENTSCFSFIEIPIEQTTGIKSLKHMDSTKLKSEIKRWAKAVVRYARQFSDHFGSSRR